MFVFAFVFRLFIEVLIIFFFWCADFLEFVATSQRMLKDESVVVVKKVIMSFTNIFPVVFVHL